MLFFVDGGYWDRDCKIRAKYFPINYYNTCVLSIIIKLNIWVFFSQTINRPRLLFYSVNHQNTPVIFLLHFNDYIK